MYYRVYLNDWAESYRFPVVRSRVGRHLQLGDRAAKPEPLTTDEVRGAMCVFEHVLIRNPRVKYELEQVLPGEEQQ